jgi:histidinol-phosphate aminotransferase
MPENTSRRQWIQQTTLATLGLGFSFRSMGNEDGLQKIFSPENNLINLGANENPYGISPKAKQAILDMMGQSNRYQFNVPALQSFKKRLASYYNVTEDQVLITPGSGDGLSLLARHFSKGNIVTADITFGILPSTAKKIGTKVIEVPLTPGKVHDLSTMLSAISNETQLVYICNPANPTGTILRPDALKNFCIEAAKTTVVLVDEAYLDFPDAPDNESMIGLIEKYPNVLVIKTFSKIHAMAGLRVGFIIGHPTLISKLQPDYFQNSQMGVSNLSMAAAMASLADEDHKKYSKQKNEAARKYTANEMKKLGIDFIPSSTNFIFYPLKNYEGDYGKDMFDKHNIILRSNTYADGKWARVSIGTMEEMQVFCPTLKSLNQ